MSLVPETRRPFIFQKGGVDYLRLCLDVTLYFVGSAFDHVDGILDFYAQSLEIIKTEVVQYQTATMSMAGPLNIDTFYVLPLWLKNPRSKQRMMMLRLDNSTTPDSAADRAFQFVFFESDKAGAVRLVLPAAFVIQSVSMFLDLAKSLGRQLAFSSGLGGYCLNWYKLGRLAGDAKREISSISKRYPGIDIPDVPGDVRVIASGIKCANWLTFLNQEYVNRFGGMGVLRKALNQEITLHSLSRGVMIQAGTRPEIGDVNRRFTLPLYHNVGQVLGSLRAKGHLPFIPSETEDERDTTEEWLARFDL